MTIKTKYEFVRDKVAKPVGKVVKKCFVGPTWKSSAKRALCSLVAMTGLAEGTMLTKSAIVQDEIFDGNIPGYKVNYEEGPERNRLVIKDGTREYTFTDSVGQTSIGWEQKKALTYGKDRLETFRVRGPGIDDTFERGTDSRGTITYDGSERMLKSADGCYKAVRDAIRENRIDGYNSNIDEIEKNLDEIKEATSKPAS